MGRAMKIPFSGIIIIWCSVMSFACFMAMGIDKLKARAKKWRIPERTLFLLAAMGGALVRLRFAEWRLAQADFLIVKC